MKTLTTLIGTLAVSLLVLPSLRAQEAEAEWKGGSATQGASIYRQYCRVCHGDSGRGDGVIAADLRVTPSDLTQLSQQNGGKFPTKDTVEVIDGRKAKAGHGTSDMPAWGDVFTRKDETEAVVKQRVTDLVEYLRSIQKNVG
jgi:mono/diheme cytochrome c family protein